MSGRSLARIFGYGNNPARISCLCHAKESSATPSELASAVQATAKQKPRKDKLTGDPIWQQAWHFFTAVKKGQSYRSKLISTERVKDKATGKMVWKSKWERHQKRYMCHKIAEMRELIIKWQPYIEWRANYLLLNPKLPRDWQVGIKRLYKEMCFCVDPEVNIFIFFYYFFNLFYFFYFFYVFLLFFS